MEATQQGGNFVAVMDEDGNPQILHRFEGVVMPTSVPSVVMSRWQTFLFPGWYLLIEPLKGAILDGTGVSGPQPMHRAVLDDGLMELAPQIVDCNIWFKVELMRLYPQFEAFDPEAAWEDMAKNIAQSPVPAEESEYMVMRLKLEVYANPVRLLRFWVCKECHGPFAKYDFPAESDALLGIIENLAVRYHRTMGCTD